MDGERGSPSPVTSTAHENASSRRTNTGSAKRHGVPLHTTLRKATIQTMPVVRFRSRHVEKEKASSQCKPCARSVPVLSYLISTTFHHDDHQCTSSRRAPNTQGRPPRLGTGSSLTSWCTYPGRRTSRCIDPCNTGSLSDSPERTSHRDTRRVSRESTGVVRWDIGGQAGDRIAHTHNAGSKRVYT